MIEKSKIDTFTDVIQTYANKMQFKIYLIFFKRFCYLINNNKIIIKFFYTSRIT